MFASPTLDPPTTGPGSHRVAPFDPLQQVAELAILIDTDPPDADDHVNGVESF